MTYSTQAEKMPVMNKDSYHLVSLENNNTAAFISSSQQLAISIELNTRDNVRYKYSCKIYTLQGLMAYIRVRENQIFYHFMTLVK